MDNLNYSEIKMQSYLTSDKINPAQKRTIFKFRTRMERFGEIFRAGTTLAICPLCKLHYDNQELSLMCPEIRNEIQVKGNMKDIYDDDIKEDIIETITNIMELRKQKLGSKWERIRKLEEQLKPIQAQVTLCAQVTEHICAARIFDDFAMAPMFLLQLLNVPWIGLKYIYNMQQLWGSHELTARLFMKGDIHFISWLYLLNIKKDLILFVDNQNIYEILTLILKSSSINRILH